MGDNTIEISKVAIDWRMEQQRDFAQKPYYQLFESKNGFLSNLSVLDLIFNEGNQAINFL